MSDAGRPLVAIMDYGVGNLFSVRHACTHAGMEAVITASHPDILASDAVILPGVGAFGDAMAMLEKRGLTDLLREIAESGKPLLGICLGMQLLMTESFEFGRRPGLGIIPGSVVRLKPLPKRMNRSRSRRFAGTGCIGWKAGAILGKGRLSRSCRTAFSCTLSTPST